MTAQKNQVVLVSQEQMDEMELAKAEVIGEQKLDNKEKTHTQMSINQMISYERDQIRRAEDRIREVRARINRRKKRIRALERAMDA